MFRERKKNSCRYMIDTLFVYYRHKPGGLCKRLYRAINACAQRGDKVTFLTLDSPPVTLHSNVSVHFIPFFTSKRDGLFFWGAFTLYLPFFLFCFSVLHSPKRIIAFGPYYAAMSLPSKLLLGRRVYLFLRSLTFKIDGIKGKPRWLRCITGAVDFIGIRTASTVIAMTEVMRTDATQFSGRALEQFPVLPNDIPKQKDSVRAELVETKHFLFAGVLDRRKNIEVLLRGWKLLEGDKDSQYILDIVGDGPDREKLESVCRSLDVEGVVFHGWQPNLNTFLERSSLYLHPSIHEGISNSLVEALGAGVPVLASDIPEHREVFEVGTSPINLVPSDEPKAWADVVQRFNSDPSFKVEIEAVCSRASKRLEFDWEERFFHITRF
jgi:glycosyltransferase involved in cell wall biosynthesis